MDEVQRRPRERIEKRGKEPYEKAEEMKGGGIGSFPTTEDPTAPITSARKGGKKDGKTSMGEKKKQKESTKYMNGTD